MKSQTKDRVTSSGPKNRTLTAYKAWIRDAASRLTTEKSTIKLTEAEWAAYWKDFWKEKSRSLLQLPTRKNVPDYLHYSLYYYDVFAGARGSIHSLGAVLRGERCRVRWDSAFFF
jgi:hypothetical protein